MRRPRIDQRSMLAAGVAFVALCAAAPSRSAEDNGAESAFRAAREYTVRVSTRIETPFLGDEEGAFEGAGFLVDAKRGWIVTNAHVVGRSVNHVQVAFHGQPYEDARPLYVDSFSDIAVLVLDRPPANRRAAPLDRVSPPSVGEAVAVYGHPLGLPFTGSRGIVSGRTDQTGPDLIQIDATIDHGNSGGPVIALRDGRILGIATAGVGGNQRDRLNFATPIDDVQRILMLLRNGISPSPPRMGFALLKDEDDRHTLRVAATFDRDRWPFQAGDRILSVEGERDSVRTLGDLVRQMRGRSESVRISVARSGKTTIVATRPSLRPLFVERRGIRIDGALFAPIDTEDETRSAGSLTLGIHSIETASTAQGLALAAGDMLVSLDGKPFADVDSLAAHVRARPGQTISVVVRRLTNDLFRTYEYHRRELPLKDVQWVPSPTTPAAVASE